MTEYFSQEGLKKIKEELEQRKSTLRPDIAQRIHEAKSLGDLSENYEYQEAVTMQSFNEGRIEELEEALRKAVVFEDGGCGCKHGLIEVGATVLARSSHGESKFTIVGSTEADPIKGFISNESPLGKAFLGKKQGDEIEVDTPKGKLKYKILQIL